jgi:hypothetical protein
MPMPFPFALRSMMMASPGAPRKPAEAGGEALHGLDHLLHDFGPQGFVVAQRVLEFQQVGDVCREPAGRDTECDYLRVGRGLVPIFIEVATGGVTTPPDGRGSELLAEPRA